MMPKMSKTKIENTFNNKKLNCIVKNVPLRYTHQDLYNYMSQFGELTSVKVSKSFYWGGKKQKDDTGKIIKWEDYIGPLVGNPQYEAWKLTQYEIVPNEYGYACFKTEEGQRRCLENFHREDNFLDIPTPAFPKWMKIEQFDISKWELTHTSNVVFFKNFPVNWTAE